MNAMIPAAAAPPSFARTIGRLVHFDLRRFRMLALLVVLLELARAAFVEWTLHLLPTAIGERLGGTFGTGEIDVVDAFLWLATVLTTAVIVQADLPSDDRAFWRTRPIAPLALAAGKLATCALLLVGVPWFVDAGRLIAYGAPISAILASGVQFAVLNGFTVAPAWALALITRTLPRFIAAGGGVIIAGFLGRGALYYWWAVWSLSAGSASMIGDRLPTFLLDWQQLDASRWWAALLTTAAAFGILVAHYRHRRRLVSIAAVVALLSASWALAQRSASAQAPASLERLVSGHLEVGDPLVLPPPLMVESGLRSSSPYPVSLGAQVTLPPLPADVSASVFLRRIQLHGRAVVHPRDAWMCCFNGGMLGVVAPALAEPRQRGGLHSSTRQGFEVDIADLDELRDRTVSLEADGEVRLMHHRFAAEIPIRPGAAVRVGDRLIEVLDYEPRRSALLIRYAEFPSVFGTQHSDLALFVGDRHRNRVSVTSFGWGGPSVNEMMAGPRRNGRSREWVSRQHVLISDAKVLEPGLRLYVVETREVGTVRTRLAKTELQVWTPNERPQR
jgi:hypothetical protein